MNILQDDHFQDGFLLRRRERDSDGKCTDTIIQLSDTEPKWIIAQWWSLYDLTEGKRDCTTEHFILEDPHKSVTVDYSTGSISLALDASHDFPGSSTTPPQKWPHLLLEQSIPADVCHIKGAQTINASLDFSIDRAKDLRTADGLHSQFAWFLYIKDTNPHSKGFGNFLWFGLNLFCPPNKVTSSYSAQDTAGGPGNYIYSISSSDIYSQNPNVGGRICFTLDILPHIRRALQTAHEHDFMIGTNPEDCSIIGTNIGWEVFDRWDVCITLHKISIDRI